MTTPNVQTDPKGWWSNQIDLHPPKNEHVAAVMDEVRASFKKLGLDLIDMLPSGPDLTVALRALKEASQSAIGAIACDQDFYQ